MRNYLLKKHYDNHYGDIIPIILANALKLNLKIFDVSNNVAKEVNVQPTLVSQNSIAIHRSNDHYSALQPKLTPPIAEKNKKTSIISYSASALLSLRNSGMIQLKRCVKNNLFKYKLWKPQGTDTVSDGHKASPDLVTPSYKRNNSSGNIRRSSDGRRNRIRQNNLVSIVINT